MGWFWASDEDKKNYTKKFVELTRKDALTKENLDKLDKWARKESVTGDALLEAQTMAIRQLIDLAEADGVVDNAEMEMGRKALQACTSFPATMRNGLLNIFQEYHQIYTMSTSGELVPVPLQNVSFVLKKGELVYYWGEAGFMKKRKQTKRVNYHGPVASIRICKGVRYRIGSVAPSFETSEFWEAADSGHFFITSQRIGFIGAAKNFTVQIPKLFNICMGDGGLNIFKEGRENPWVVKLDAGHTPELPLFIIDSLLNGIEPINTQG